VTSARADELPVGHCSLAVSFEDLQNYLDAQLTGILDAYGVPVNGGLVSYTGSRLSIDAKGPDEESSDDDLLLLTMNINTPLGEKRIEAKFFLRETPENAATECVIRPLYSIDHSLLLTGDDLIRLCVQGVDDPDRCWLYVGGSQYYVPLGLDSGLLNAALNQNPRMHGTTKCHRVFFEDCRNASRWLDMNGVPLTNCAQSHAGRMTVICEEKHFGQREVVTTDPADFPGPLARSVEHDFGPLVDITAPGHDRTIRQYIEYAGMVDQSDWEIVDGVLVSDTYLAKCYLQKLLKENLGPVLRSGTNMGGLSFSFGDVALLGGGIRISETTEKIYFLIPSLLSSLDVEAGLDSASQPCTSRPELAKGFFTDRLAAYSSTWEAVGGDWARIAAMSVLQDFSLIHLDFPKLLHHFLASSDDIAGLGLHVECEHGFDCDQHGGDDDHDGFCNDGPNREFCKDTPTSSNCDWDGDGFGDGPSYLLGRPPVPAQNGLPARGRILPECLNTDLFPEFQNGGEKLRMSLMNFACGGCDNCGRTPNPDEWVRPLNARQRQLPRAFRSDTSSAVDSGTAQPDWDFDWVGDACDPDVDGDGVLNEVDCARMSTHLRLDIDGDGHCENHAGITSNIGSAFDMASCIQECWIMASSHRLRDPAHPDDPRGMPYMNTLDCQRTCDKGLVPDNCAPRLTGFDTWCDAVYEYCLDPAKPGAEFAHCTPAVREYCTMQYANPGDPLQKDFDGDGVGDKCDTGSFDLAISGSSRVWPYFHGPSFEFGCNLWNESVEVRMRNFGGNAEWTDGQPRPHYAEQARTAFEVGSCACAWDGVSSPAGGQMEWLSTCNEVKCPSNIDPIVGEENEFRHKYWNPVSEPAYAATHPNGCEDDAACTARDALRIAQATEAGLVYGRKQGFTRDEAANQLALEWNWRDARQAWWKGTYAGATPLGWYYRAGYRPPSKDPMVLTRVRVAWPNYRANATSPVGYDYHQQTGLTYSQTAALEVVQGQCFGDVYIGPPFVLDIIPGIVDLWGRDEDWLRGAAMPGSGLNLPEAASFLLGRSSATDELLLYRLSAGGFGLQMAQRFTGTDLDSRASVSTVVAVMDGGLLGLDGGRHRALVAYQQPFLSLPPDEISHGGMLAPARLLVGRLSEGEVVTLTDAELIAGQAAPSLLGGRLVARREATEVVLIGRATAAGGGWRLARLSLASGEWTSPRQLPLGVSDDLLYAGENPATGQLLLITRSLVGGVTAAPEPVVQAWWLDPMTLGLVPASEPAPADLSRDRATIVYEPGLRKVWLAGGVRGDEVLSDVWQLDLGHQIFTPVATLPVPLAAPVLAWDNARQRLWVGEPRTDVAGLDAWAFDPAHGTWIETTAPAVPAVPDWPVDDTYVAGRSYLYPFNVDAAAPLPGTVVLGRLTATAPWLGLELWAGASEQISTSEADPITGEDLVAGLCPPGETCTLSVRPVGSGPEPAVPFTLDAQSATLEPAGQLYGPTLARTVTAQGDLLYLVGPLGVRTVRASTLDTVGWALTPALLGSQAGAWCGSHLCVVRPGPQGFMVVEMDTAGQATLVGRTGLGAQAQDLAVWGSQAFVAMGTQGVSVVSLANPASPVVTGAITSTGQVVSVAARDGVLAVGLKNGTVELHDVRQAPVRVGTVTAGFRLSKVRFVAGQLWLLDQAERQVEVWRVSTPAAPQRVGTFTDRAEALMTGVWRGARLFALEGGLHLRVFRAQ
jgi:hypothetical protein